MLVTIPKNINEWSKLGKSLCFLNPPRSKQYSHWQCAFKCIEVLNIAGTQGDGELPTEIGDLSNLGKLQRIAVVCHRSKKVSQSVLVVVLLNLYNSGTRGTIPTELSNLRNLRKSESMQPECVLNCLTDFFDCSRFRIRRLRIK
jgi:hypothetical protein